MSFEGIEIHSFKVYGQNVNFEIDYAKNVIVEREDGVSLLHIKDTFMDIKAMEDILNGKYDNEIFRIEGKATVRDIETNEYYYMKIDVKVAKIKKYRNVLSKSPILTFQVPSRDEGGDIQFILEDTKW